MKLPELFSLLNSVSSAYSTHWNFYSAVVLGMLAGIALSKKGTRIHGGIGALLLVGLIAFFVSNYIRIENTFDEIKVIKGEITMMLFIDELMSPDFERFYTESNDLRTNSNWMCFHIAIDIFLILAIICRVYGGLIKTQWNNFIAGQK